MEKNKTFFPLNAEKHQNTSVSVENSERQRLQLD